MVSPQAPGEIAVMAPAETPMPEFEVDAGWIVGDVVYESAAGGAVGTPVAITEPAANREIIFSGWANLISADPIAASQGLAAQVEALGGFVASRRETPAVGERSASASLTLRIPAARLDAVVSSLSTFGEVEGLTVEQVDVTAQGADLDARISAIQISVNRLTELLATAADTADLLQVEQELSRRQAELDGLRASRSALSDQVALSTLEVFIWSRDSGIVITPSGFLGAIRSGWSALAQFGSALLVGFGAAIPWLITAGILWAALVPLVRAIRRRRAKRPERRGRRHRAREQRSEYDDVLSFADDDER